MNPEAGTKAEQSVAVPAAKLNCMKKRTNEAGNLGPHNDERRQSGGLMNWEDSAQAVNSAGRQEGSCRPLEAVGDGATVTG